MAKKENLILIPRPLRYKLRMAVSLMSVLPFLVSVYLVSRYIFPRLGWRLEIIASIFISLFIAGIGFLVIKEVFDRILSVSTEAKLIISGDYSRRLTLSRDDEVGDLGEALNQLTQRIRDNMDELKNYSEKTSQINLDIQKRVMVLSSLLQISSLISQGAKIDDTLNLATEKSRLLANSESAYLFLRESDQAHFSMKSSDGIDANHLLKITLEPHDEIFFKSLQSGRALLVDKENILSDILQASFYKKFKLKNTLAIPIYLKGKAMAILGIGNTRDDFLYRKDDVELLDVFSKQIAIALENDLLIHRIEKLEIKDALTGLYNEGFIRSRLQEEIRRSIAYQRPCAFILLNVDNFSRFYQVFGSLQAEAVLKKMSGLIRDSVTEVDRVGRFGDNEFALILPEKNKRQAQDIAEDIRRKIEFTFAEEPRAEKRLTVCGAVSENPLDGIEAEELIKKAQTLLSDIASGAKNRIFV